MQSVITEATETDDCDDDDDVRDSVTSCDHQLIMTWCWLNIRVSEFTLSCDIL